MEMGLRKRFTLATGALKVFTAVVHGHKRSSKCSSRSQDAMMAVKAQFQGAWIMTGPDVVASGSNCSNTRGKPLSNDRLDCLLRSSQAIQMSVGWILLTKVKT